MNPSLAKALLARESSGVQLLYGVATATNTVMVAGSTVAVVLPALEPVATGDYVAVLASGADRLILGAVGGGKIAYAQITSNSSSFTLVTLITGLSITFTAVAGRRYRLSFEGEVVQSVGTDVWSLALEDTVSTLKQITGSNQSTASATVVGSYVNNSSISGSKTWRVNGQRISGTGNITVAAAATYPAWIMVEDIGII